MTGDSRQNRTPAGSAIGGRPPAGVATRPLLAWGRAFSRPEVRFLAVLAMLVAAVVSPNLRLPGSLPAVRLDQILLAVCIPPFLVYGARERSARVLLPLDLGFGVFTAAILISILVAPFIVPVVGRSSHDLFDLTRPAEYWLLFRIALTVDVSRVAATRILVALSVVAIAAGLFAFVQYRGVGRFNEVVTAIWATSHNLDGVIRGGRVVGTAADADTFGVIAACLALAALWTFFLRASTAGISRILVPLAVWAGIQGLVLTQSRGATLGALAGLAAGVVLSLVVRRRGRWPAASGVLVAAVALSVAVASFVPTNAPVPSSIASRFDVSSVSEDPSVVLRLARLRTLFGATYDTPSSAALCAGSSPASPPPGHELVADPAPATFADAAVHARDEQRKADVAAIARALSAKYCRDGRWPAAGDPAVVLSEAGLTELPKDPSTGAAYALHVGPGGYEVSAQLEDPTDPDGPVYAATSAPNLVLNPSLELGAVAPNNWGSDAGSKFRVSPGDARFGAHAGRVTFGLHGYVDHFVVYTLPTSADLTASIWLRAPEGTAASIRFYATLVLADGEHISPVSEAVPVLPADGSWVRTAISFRTPAKGLVYVVQLVLQPVGTSRPTVDIDGASLTTTTVAPAFALTRDVDPARLESTVPSFFRSPVVGLGPLNNVQIGGDPGEYVLILVKYGGLGLLAYLMLFAIAGLSALWAWRRTDGPLAAVAMTAGAMTAIGAVFAVTTAFYNNYQLMAMYWLLIGLTVAAGRSVPSAARSDLAAGRTTRTTSIGGEPDVAIRSVEPTGPAA